MRNDADARRRISNRRRRSELLEFFRPFSAPMLTKSPRLNRCQHKVLGTGNVSLVVQLLDLGAGENDGDDRARSPL